MEYFIVFAAEEPIPDSDRVGRHIFEARFQSDDLILMQGEDADTYIDGVMMHVLESRGKQHLYDSIVPSTVHVCVLEPCLDYQMLVAALNGTLKPHSAAGIEMWSTGQRGEA